jgi:hypothetical protein
MSDWGKMRLGQSLDATLIGESGHQDALAQWLDYEIIHLLTRTRLPESEPLRVYLTVPPQGRVVELSLVIQEIARPPGASTRAWLHRARWTAVVAEEGKFLASALRSINPSAQKATSWAKRSKKSAARVGRPSDKKSPPTATARPETTLNVGASGAPANLLVGFSSRDQLGSHVALQSGGFLLKLELEASLPIGTEMVVALQLPDHQFVQAMAIVNNSRGREYELQALVVARVDLAVLRQALGDP